MKLINDLIIKYTLYFFAPARDLNPGVCPSGKITTFTVAKLLNSSNMNNDGLKEKLDQILANQAVLYKMLRELKNPNKSTPDNWILDEFEKEAKKFKD